MTVSTHKLGKYASAEIMRNSAGEIETIRVESMNLVTVLHADGIAALATLLREETYRKVVASASSHAV